MLNELISDPVSLMWHNPVKNFLLTLMLIVSSNVFADGYNITVNVDGNEVSFSDENGVSNNDAVSIEDNGSISISYKDSAAKSRYDSAPAWNDGSKHRGRKKYDTIVAKAADKHQVDPKLLHAVIQAESAYNEKAVSTAGAVGLMQLMPGTARQYGVTDRSDPLQSIEGGTRYLRHLLDMFDSNLKLTLAAYNAGENAVIKNHNRIPPYAETRHYVKRVLSLQKGAKRGSSDSNDTVGSSDPFKSWGYNGFISDND